jgi:hypothetical protein
MKGGKVSKEHFTSRPSIGPFGNSGRRVIIILTPFAIFEWPQLCETESHLIIHLS